MSTLKSLLTDAVKVINSQAEDYWTRDSFESMNRLREALGTDCHGDLYEPDIQLKVEEEPSAVERLTDLAMELFPQDLVEETKDIDELIRAAAAHIEELEAQVARERHVFLTRLEDLKNTASEILAGLSAEWSEEDREDQHTKAIEAAHPLKTGDHRRYARALQMVGNRRGKYALVDLVNWLLMRAEEKTG